MEFISWFEWFGIAIRSVLFYFEMSPITGRSKPLLLGKGHFSVLPELEYETVMGEFKNDMLTDKEA